MVCLYAEWLFQGQGWATFSLGIYVMLFRSAYDELRNRD